MSIIRKKWKIGELIHPLIDSDFEIMQYLQISLERVPIKTKQRASQNSVIKERRLVIRGQNSSASKIRSIDNISTEKSELTKKFEPRVIIESDKIISHFDTGERVRVVLRHQVFNYRAKPPHTS